MLFVNCLHKLPLTSVRLIIVFCTLKTCFASFAHVNRNESRWAVSRISTSETRKRLFASQLHDILYNLKVLKAFESAEIHEKLLRVKQLQALDKWGTIEPFFIDSNPLKPIASLFVALDSENFWSQWARPTQLFQQEPTMTLANHDAVQSDENQTAQRKNLHDVQIQGKGRAPPSSLSLERLIKHSPLVPASLLLLRHHVAITGFICTWITLKSNRESTKQEPPPASGGVVFGFDSKTNQYWTVMLVTDRSTDEPSLSLLRLMTDGTIVEQHAASQVPGGIIPWRRYSLGIQFDSSTIRIYLNTFSVLSINNKYPPYPGKVGVAVGNQEATFQNFCCGALRKISQAPAELCFKPPHA